MVYLYIFFFLLYVFDSNFLFANEEFLICICMVLVLYFLFNSLRKFLSTFFYFRAEFIYFSFLYLIKLNKELSKKIIALISMEDLKLHYFFLDILHTTFFNLLFLKKRILSMFFRLALNKFINNVLFLLFIKIASTFSSIIFISEREDRFLETVNINVSAELLLYSRSDFSEVIDNVIEEDIIIEEPDSDESLGPNLLEPELESEEDSLVLDTSL